MVIVMNKLDYNYSNKTVEGTFRISASSVYGFINSTNAFFREKCLGEEGFIGSTASVAGTCLHWCCECVTTNGTLSAENKEEMYEYISLQASDLVNEQEVRSMITPMWSALRDWLLANPGSLAEPFIEIPTDVEGIFHGGSIDMITSVSVPGFKATSLKDLVGHRVKIQDFKSTSRKPTSLPKRLEMSHKWQLLVYAKCLESMGITVESIEVIYITKEHIGEISEKTGKQLKSYPSEVVVLNEPVTSSDLEFIESIIFVVAHSVEAFINKPELRYLLARDKRLIENTDVLPFTVGEQIIIDI